MGGTGHTRFGRLREGLVELLAAASREALGDGRRGVDALFLGTQGVPGCVNAGAKLADALGIEPVPAFRVETASSSGAAALHAAWCGVASGRYGRVLVAAGERMSGLDTPHATALLADVLHPYEVRAGATMPALAALAVREYMARYGLSREALSAVAVKNHANGVLNPLAHFQKSVTAEEVAAARPVATPLTLLDCAPLSDGACAAVLDGGAGDIVVAGIGAGTDALALHEREDPTTMGATRAAARAAYEMAHLTRKEVDVAEVHDAFTILEIIATEDVGLFGPGDGGRAVERGITAPGGALPVNPSGGLKARGHPVGASGLAQVVELARQLRGEAGKRQIDGASVGLAQSTGGFGSCNLVTLLRRAG